MTDTSGNAALRVLIMLLGEHGIRCSESSMGTTLVALMATRDDEAMIAVDAKLAPSRKIFQYLHCYAHVVAGHVRPGFGVRIEHAEQERTHLHPDFQRQEEEADRLIRSWIDGEQLPDALRPLSGCTLAAHKDFKVRALTLVRDMGVASGCSAMLDALKLEPLKASLRRALDARKRRVCLEHLDGIGRSLASTNVASTHSGQATRLPDRGQRHDALRKELRVPVSASEFELFDDESDFLELIGGPDGCA